MTCPIITFVVSRGSTRAFPQPQLRLGAASDEFWQAFAAGPPNTTVLCCLTAPPSRAVSPSHHHHLLSLCKTETQARLPTPSLLLPTLELGMGHLGLEFSPSIKTHTKVEPICTVSFLLFPKIGFSRKYFRNFLLFSFLDLIYQNFQSLYFLHFNFDFDDSFTNINLNSKSIF